jgi:sugar phosphate permease
MKKTLLFYRAQMILITFLSQAVFSSTRTSWSHIQQFLAKDYFPGQEPLAKILDVVFAFTFGLSTVM